MTENNEMNILSDDDDEIGRDDGDSKIDTYTARLDLYSFNLAAFDNSIRQKLWILWSFGIYSQIWWGSRQYAGVLANLLHFGQPFAYNDISKYFFSTIDILRVPSPNG